MLASVSLIGDVRSPRTGEVPLRFGRKLIRIHFIILNITAI